MKKIAPIFLIMTLFLTALFAVGCQGGTPATSTAKAETTTAADAAAVETTAVEANAIETTAAAVAADISTGKSIILSTTTSTEDSGLLGFILPDFTAKTGYGVKVVAVGTGAALKNGEEGNADVLLVHAKKSEEKFVADGFGVARFDVMYNDFILVGPKDDSLSISAEYRGDAAHALEAIATAGSVPFISRGDDSGTHKKELEIWAAAGVEPKGDWYIEAGQGMGAVLAMAEEKQAYTLTDRATYLSRKDDLTLVIVGEGDKALMNQYGVIAVSPKISENINEEGAKAFVDWILSADTQKLLGEFGVKEFGQPLFFPNATP